jgi:dCTP deaminase
VVGYRARRFAPPLDIDLENAADPADYWEPIAAPPRGQYTLDPGEFHILASLEAMQVPADLAAEMVAIDPNMGEFRVHYAGFFDPGFGHSPGGGAGARAVLEVRSLEIPYILEHGQAIARMRFEPLAEAPDRIYGQTIGSHYQSQGLKLSKHFRAW